MKNSTTLKVENKFGFREITYKIFAILFWIFIWHTVAVKINKMIIVPTPLETVLALKKLSAESEFWISILMTIYRVIVGFLLASIVGCVLGVLASINKWVYIILNPLVVTIKSVPVISIIIISLTWFVSGNVPIFIAFLMCMPIVWTNVISGFSNIDKNLIQMARIYNVKKTRIIKEIYLPSIKNYILAGMTTAIGLSWKVVVAAEVLSSPKNAIGNEIYSAKAYVETDSLFAWTLVIVMFSFLFEFLFKKIILSFELKNQIGGAEYDY